METMNRSVEYTIICGHITNRRRVKIILRNGFQIRGTISAQDDVVIVVFDDENKKQVESIIYKNGISTIVPI